ncbi:hypothetical protein [Halorussus salinus]|uniref:hypothetical protein n=1 Tax=Halorussus salinus TaxID=1364935 RepID=UPI0010924AF4|nr:hypothetical protein [Halorussus salinus]
MTNESQIVGYTSREWLFLTGFAAATAATWYLTEPTSSRVASSLASGLVTFVVTAVAVRLSSERARQTLLDVLGFLLP